MEPIGAAGIAGRMLLQFLPVWIAMVAVFWLSIAFRRNLGLFGRLFESRPGLVGFGIVLFWVLTAIFADWIQTFPALSQIAAMKNQPPGSPVPGTEGAYYLFGGDNLGRDVFSRMVAGSRSVLLIAPAATLFAFMVGITLGLPAGYFTGRFDTLLSFAANLVLAFPVILLFYLLVTPEIRDSGYEILRFGAYSWRSSIPNVLAALLFIFPVIFLTVLFQSRYFTRPARRNVLVSVTLAVGLWVYAGLAFHADPTGIFSMDPNLLNIFVAVVFVNSPTVFRIVRGLTMDIKTRDYVAAAQTRGEGAWYIMLWEILPNARGPLIVDFCLRIGYTTILLGTLGFFGLGVSPESPDWGMTINEGRRLLSVYPHPAIPPAVALMSLVLGLNLLADGLREESLKD
jgi:peptide/nickel transport system permease protein